MTNIETVNRKFVLAKRPKGEPTTDTLKLVREQIPYVSA
jgi:hypothetical protein